MSINKGIYNGVEQYYVTYYVKSKRHRKFFKLDEEEEAIKWDKEHSSQKQKGRVSLTVLTDAQAKDAEAAIAELPAGRTLLESVRKAWEFESKASISTLKKEYLASLEPFVGKEHLCHVKGRLKSFERSFGSFTDATPDALIRYLRERGCNKTVAHYRSMLNDFFRYCLRKDAIKANPLDKILDGDIMKNEAPKEVEFLNTEQTYRLLLYLICKHPKHLKFFILALFAGVRVGEVQRMKESYIDYDTQSIIFPAEIVKGRRHKKKSWHVQDYEPVLFEWLNLLKGKAIIRPNNVKRTQMGKDLGLPGNFARHTFATKHLSLYKDAERTRFITRHDRKETLENKYFGALEPKEVARAFFNITPDALVKWVKRLKKEDYEAVAGGNVAQKDFSKHLKGLPSDK